MIINTNIIAAITLFCKLFNIVLMPLDWSWLYKILIEDGKLVDDAETTSFT